MDWAQLLNQSRRKSDSRGEHSTEANPAESRTEIERDHDRILFSTPVRRLADKTQVFPLDKNDSVRTRLTHSFEVSNLARSVGTALAFRFSVASSVEDSLRNLPAVCASIGLVHDLGNPPFGHQGESAIQRWFVENSQVLNGLNGQQEQDFLKFEGNAQGFRLVSRLQLLNDDFGLDLTYATLAAMMKYPTPSHERNDSSAATKKHGFFFSEQQIAETVLAKTGLSLKKRHPLAYVMEACDDIAYVVFDAEDAVKKGLASISDLHAWLEHEANGDAMISNVVAESKEKHSQYRSRGLSPAELNDVSMQRFRVAAIGAMINAATQTFVDRETEFLQGSVSSTLMAASPGERLRKALKDFSFRHAYTHRSVLCLELKGYNVIRSLMDMFWAAIVDRDERGADDPEKLGAPRRNPFTRLVYGRISENYRRAFEQPSGDAKELPVLYRECQLLTDMISGMTDSFAMDLHAELTELIGEFDPKNLVA